MGDIHRVLVVDDEKRIRSVIREYAEYEGYSVEEAADGIAAVELCQKKDFDVIIMDVMMPRLDGFSACKEIKKLKDIPVIILSARGEEYDKLFGFEIGIDDYVVKPFSLKELMARVKVVVSRHTARPVSSVFIFGGLVIDTQGRSVLVDGQKTRLTNREYELLVYMVTNKNTALSRKELLSSVWRYEFYDDDRTVDAHIKMLRSSLGAYREHIVTIRGVGYKFEAE